MPPSTSGRMPDATLLRNSVNLGRGLCKTGHPPWRRPGRAPQIFGNGRVRLSAESRYAEIKLGPTLDAVSPIFNRQRANWTVGVELFSCLADCKSAIQPTASRRYGAVWAGLYRTVTCGMGTATSPFNGLITPGRGDAGSLRDQLHGNRGRALSQIEGACAPGDPGLRWTGSNCGLVRRCGRHGRLCVG